MSLQIGSITTVAVITAIISNSADPATIQAFVYAATAVLLIVCLPLIRRVPEHHGSW
jgi:hypothetical protein